MCVQSGYIKFTNKYGTVCHRDLIFIILIISYPQRTLIIKDTFSQKDHAITIISIQYAIGIKNN